MKNRELFNNDPLSFTIPNDGVTTISNPKNANEWEIVKYELRSFVCEGEYQKGLERILSTFLANLDQPKQPAVWVSGFYGSGKSHLLKMFAHLWQDTAFSDGATARSLVHDLPEEILESLKELDVASRRSGERSSTNWDFFSISWMKRRRRSGSVARKTGASRSSRALGASPARLRSTRDCANAHSPLETTCAPERTDAPPVCTSLLPANTVPGSRPRASPPRRDPWSHARRESPTAAD